MKGPLSGLAVVEFGELVSAPYCGKIMADLGAEVIKIEKPGLGDDARRREPFLRDIRDEERSGLFLYLNTSKLGITLDVASKSGLLAFQKLLRQTDVLIENNPPQRMFDLGLDFETLHDLNSRLVVTSITHYGQTGPYRDYNAYEINAYHAGGIGYLTREREIAQEPGPPMKGAGDLAAFQGGANAVVATMCALYARDIMGIGQHVDISEQECLASIIDMAIPLYVHHGQVQGKGATIPLVAPCGLVPCKDGEVVVVCLEDAHWRGLVDLIGTPDWTEDEWCQESFSRGQHWDILASLLQPWFMEHTKEEILREGQARHVPICTCNNMEDLVKDPHLNARHFFVDVEHPIAGRMRYPGWPFKLSQTPFGVYRSAPRLGEHNEQIFCDRLGYSKQELTKMYQVGTV